uniref:WGS project CBMG000000000 data, contig CS5907-c001794 n=1 Tax=Fusarium acuminatum CS5907 TaxID=1318461 RepID=A0A090MFF1_9HYPO|nr:unnamed protein product [Fusarium acuminatum CS5907]
MSLKSQAASCCLNDRQTGYDIKGKQTSTFSHELRRFPARYEKADDDPFQILSKKQDLTIHRRAGKNKTSIMSKGQNHYIHFTED